MNRSLTDLGTRGRTEPVPEPVDLLAYDRLTGRTDGRTDGLTKMNSPSDINSRNATPAGGQDESINSSPVHGLRPAKIEGWPKVAGYCPACGTASLFLGSGGWVTCSLDKCPNPTAVADLIEHRRDLSVPAPQPNPSTARLDWLEREVIMRELGKVKRDRDEARAEVEELRETVDDLAQSTSDLGRDLLIEGERADAAVAEASRVREALQAAREFVGWLTAMGQPTNEALKTRRAVTLGDIICSARAALRALDAALDGAE